MSSAIIIILCLIIAVIIQIILCKKDNIYMGLIVPAIFILASIIMSLLVKGDTLLKVNTFMQWISPGVVALVIYIYIKKKKYDLRKMESEEYRKNKEYEINKSNENEIIEVEAEIIDDDIEIIHSFLNFSSFCNIVF